MASAFEPSPRATKRRRTANHGTTSRSPADNDISEFANDHPVEPATQVAMHDHSSEDGATSTRSTRSVTKRTTSSRRKVNYTNNVKAALHEREEQSVSNDSTEVGKDEEVTPKPRSSGRQRRPPKRLVEAEEEAVPIKDLRNSAQGVLGAGTVSREPTSSAPASPSLRGILTPSRKQKGGPRKSVMFDQNEKEVEEQFGFRDIGTPATKKPVRKSTPHPKKAVELEVNIPNSDVVVAENSNDEVAVTNQNEAVQDAMTVDEAPTIIPVPKLSAASQLYPSTSNGDEPGLQKVKHSVLARLTGSKLPLGPPGHLESQYNELRGLLKATVETSESNSLLLLGPRGAGKSMLINLALQDLSGIYADNFHTVRLNGFMQTDDRIALREIWRQLGHSRALDEAETEEIGASYADTMASLLSLLSHPDEIIVDVTSTSGTQTTSKSIVFILDEFDLFTTHPRQTLLYNLFDIAQSRKAPIAVVGCSSRMDVIECLEKRVKSRFSHRWLLVPSCRTVSEWDAEVRRALLIDDEISLRASEEEQNWTARWNTYIKDTLLSSKDVQQLTRRHFHTTKSLPDLFIAFVPFIATLQPDETNQQVTLNQSILPAQEDLFVSPTIISLLPSLPILHLSLLVSMCRLESIHTLAISNFNLVYTHYTELIQSSRLKQSAHGSLAHPGTLREWSREICREAWEELGLAAIIVPVIGARDEDGGFAAAGGNSGAEMEDTRSWRSEVTLDDVLWEVKEKFADGSGFGGGAGEVLTRWCKEV